MPILFFHNYVIMHCIILYSRHCTAQGGAVLFPTETFILDLQILKNLPLKFEKLN